MRRKTLLTYSDKMLLTRIERLSRIDAISPSEENSVALSNTEGIIEDRMRALWADPV